MRLAMRFSRKRRVKVDREIRKINTRRRCPNRLLIYTSEMLREKAECAGSGTPVPNLSRLIILHYAKRVSFFSFFFYRAATPLINGCSVNGWHNTSAINCSDQAVSHPTTAHLFLAVVLTRSIPRSSDYPLVACIF